MADTDVISELERKLEDSKEIRRRQEPQWFLNLAMHDGQQWVAWDGNRLFEPRLEEWRATVTDNRIRPTVRTEIARLTKSQPVWVGVPKDGSSKELAAARMRERVFEHYWQPSQLSMVRKLRAALLWSRTTGGGFLKCYWDSTKGKQAQVLHGPDGKPAKNQYGAPIKPDMLDQLPQEYAQTLQPKAIAMGDACVELRTPFELYPDDLAGEEGLESAEWIIEEAVHSPSYVARRFGKTLEPDSAANLGAVESRFPVGLANAGGRKTGVKVREFWALPNSTYPRGKWCVWAGNRLLQEDDNPYPWLPYIMFSGAPAPGRFWPACVVTDLISQQTSLNKRESQIEENADRIGNPPLMRSSANEEVEWHGLPGEEIVFQDMGTPGSVPQFLQVPELGTYVREDVERHVDAMREISGHYEISAGGVPSGVTAASAINLLLEQNDTVLGPDVQEIETALTGLGQRVLWMLRNYASDERFVKIAGEDGAWELQAWKGDTLGDCDEDGIKIGSGVPQSKAAKQAAIQEVLNMLVQSGVPLSERDMRQVLQEYEVGGLEKFFATIGEDERQVARENLRLAAGTPLEINSFDDDEIHIAGHQSFQKSGSWDDVPPPVQAQFEEHVQAHIQRHSQAQQQQAQEQIAQPAAQAGAVTAAQAAAQPPEPAPAGQGQSQAAPAQNGAGAQQGASQGPGY